MVVLFFGRHEVALQKRMLMIFFKGNRISLLGEAHNDCGYSALLLDVLEVIFTS
jgi:hypothetical protein